MANCVETIEVLVVGVVFNRFDRCAKPNLRPVVVPVLVSLHCTAVGRVGRVKDSALALGVVRILLVLRNARRVTGSVAESGVGVALVGH